MEPVGDESVLRLKWVALSAVLALVGHGGQRQAQSTSESPPVSTQQDQTPCKVELPEASAEHAGDISADAADQVDEGSAIQRDPPHEINTSVEIVLERKGDEINWTYGARGHRNWLIMSVTVGSARWSDTRKLTSYKTTGNLSVPHNIGVDFSAAVEDSTWDYGGGVQIEVSGQLRPGENSARAGCSL